MEEHEGEYPDETQESSMALASQRREPSIEEKLMTLKATRRSIHDALLHSNEDLFEVAQDLQAKVAALEQENRSLRQVALQRDSSYGYSSPEPSLRQFAVVLLDADSYIFRYQCASKIFYKPQAIQLTLHRFLTRGTAGGRDAASELHSKVQAYLASELAFPSSGDIVVKAYANHRGLASHLVASGFIGSERDFALFVEAFNQRMPLFEFADVGAGKERADHKIRRWLEHFVANRQCAHILLGCGHDRGYETFLEQFGADPAVAARITIVRGAIMHVDFAKLGFGRAIGLWTVFHDRKVLKGGSVSLSPDEMGSTKPVGPSTPKGGHQTKTEKRLNRVLETQKGKGVVYSSPPTLDLTKGQLGPTAMPVHTSKKVHERASTGKPADADLWKPRALDVHPKSIWTSLSERLLGFSSERRDVVL